MQTLAEAAVQTEQAPEQHTFDDHRNSAARYGGGLQYVCWALTPVGNDLRGKQNGFPNAEVGF